MSSRRYTPKHATYTPHRSAPRHRHDRSAALARTAPVKVIKTTALLGSVAAAATGIAVSNGVLADPIQAATVATDLGKPANALDQQELDERRATVSRSDSRDRTDDAKADSLSADSGPGVARSEDLSQADPRTIARSLLGDFGFSQDQFSCLDSLYMSESGWRVDADNPSSSAYGIPQALPGSKMASAGADWATNPVTQITWGLGYIQDSYGSPCSAWSFKASHGWY